MSDCTVGTPIRVSSTTTLATGPCKLLGWLVNSTTSGTITLHDGINTNPTAFVAAIPTVAGAYTQCPAALANGLHFVLGNTLNVTFFVGY
jgi:hypothetical protein